MPLVFDARRGFDLAIRPDRPDWAAVNASGAEALRRLERGDSPSDIAADLAATNDVPSADASTLMRHFARETRHLWNGASTEPYEGRAAHIRPHELRELWVHVNDRCNFACRHCLVSGGPSGSEGLPTEALLSVIDEAQQLGVETFFITGGEPLLRDDLARLLAAMLARPEVHVVILTNGAFLEEPFLAEIEALDPERLHFQVSLDGSTRELNDRLRAPGAFDAAVSGIRAATAAGHDITVSTVVLEENLDDLPALVRLLPTIGVRNQHLMWQHVRERGAKERRAGLEELIGRVLALRDEAELAGTTLDNYEHLRAIANGRSGVKRDLTNACWDSLAIYTDGHAYPSAALVGIAEYQGDNVTTVGLRRAWLDSPAFEAYRGRSAVEGAALDADPLLFLHGGGDPEHAYFFGQLNGDGSTDPYVPLYRELMLSAIDEAGAAGVAAMSVRDDLPVAYTLMGQGGVGCPVSAGVANGGAHRVDFAHSNCVLIQDVVNHSRRLVQDYYGDAAKRPKSEICCPVQGAASDLSHIPESLMARTYGCGSPVFAADVQPGETLVDLGSGVGVECFAGAKLVGPNGRAIGIDMTPDMLEVSRGAIPEVAEALGYGNVEFVEGFLEDLPLADESADVAISNCVINLSPEKLKVFSEVRRILSPGGRMVISDIVADREIPDDIRHNPQLKSECIGGALTQDELLFMLSKLGFTDVKVMHHVKWREVDGVQFYSDTIHATRAAEIAPPQYVVDNTPGDEEPERHEEGCLVCGKPLVYSADPSDARCELCGRELRTRARCEGGHFICDQCHGGDYLRFVHSYVGQCELTDPVTIFIEMRTQFPFPLHGPEHHALVPAAFLVAYRNSGGEISPQAIEAAIDQGAQLPGGTCAYWGGCSAALGLGVAYGTILEATPVKSRGRKYAQTVVAQALSRMAEFLAPRCCRRESLLALKIGADMSAELLPTTVTSTAEPDCDQVSINPTCVKGMCPFAP